MNRYDEHWDPSDPAVALVSRLADVPAVPPDVEASHIAAAAAQARRTPTVAGTGATRRRRPARLRRPLPMPLSALAALFAGLGGKAGKQCGES